MLKKSLIIGALASLSTHASADVGVMLGVGYTFGGAGPAITLKALSTDKQDEGVVAAGVSYYPLSPNKFGVDVGAGYQADNAAAIVSWDFLQSAVQVSAGWSDTSSHKHGAAPSPTPPPPPSPPPPPP